MFRALSFALFGAIVIIVPAQSQTYGGVRIVPKVGADSELLVQIQNLSKLQVSITGGTLEFRGASTTTPCVLRLALPASIGPAETLDVKMTSRDEMLRCLGILAGRTISRFGTPLLSDSPAGPGAGAPKPAVPVTAAFSFRVSGKETTQSATWQVPIE